MKKRRRHPEQIIRQPKGTCYLCWRLNGRHGEIPDLETHHVFFGTANRIKSEERGLKVRLCRHHHEMVHREITVNRFLQRESQKQWESMPGNSREKWMEIFGRNYLTGSEE